MAVSLSGEATLGVGASIGIVPILAGGQPAEVLRAADASCSLAKRAR